MRSRLVFGIELTAACTVLKSPLPSAATVISGLGNDVVAKRKFENARHAKKMNDRIMGRVYRCYGAANKRKPAAIDNAAAWGWSPSCAPAPAFASPRIAAALPSSIALRVSLAR